MNKRLIVAPSILAANFGHLQADIEMINNSTAPWIHIDIMDGVFVPNISFGFSMIKTIGLHTNKHLDVHLMIIQPERYIQNCKNAGANSLTVHIEACTHLHRTVNEIKEAGMMPGVALNPHTPIELLNDIINEIDIVCIMSVNPGFGGQKFINNTYSKIERLQNLIQQKNTQTLIQIDGGVDAHNASALIAAGANILVAGNSVFNTTNPIKAIKNLIEKQQ